DATGVIRIFIGRASSVIAFIVTSSARGRSRLHQAWISSVAGTSPVATAGLVFVATSGALNALDARTGLVLWSSSEPSPGGTIGNVHWQSPIVVDGGVYVSDGNRHLTAYTLNGTQ